MDFVPGVKPPADRQKAWWFLFHEEKVLVTSQRGGVGIPLVKDPAELGVSPVRPLYIGALDGVPCYASDLAGADLTGVEGVFHGLRGLLGHLGESWFRVAGLAWQIVYWDRIHQYCGLCGAGTVPSSVERARHCNQCGQVYYPRIAPAVIVAVVRGDEILLGHAHRFPRGELYSVLAGFVEPGESLEECVRREVREEAGIELRNIRYFSSQPWPFPHSLMVGFTAEYAGGDVRVETSELRDVGWFGVHALPDIPDRRSISRELIDWFVRQCRD